MSMAARMAASPSRVGIAEMFLSGPAFKQPRRRKMKLINWQNRFELTQPVRKSLPMDQKDARILNGTSATKSLFPGVQTFRLRHTMEEFRSATFVGELISVP